ncbi:hypothetical protein GCM10007874_45730 [Labrys miyagiensis]|uniref:YCII-related domain-containing protein n=1 Tax=Labrys miyagiensis TaxID=346912 RepID=A0ABQ6CMJ7_9HYPH|nr:hypothetical protein GCM10007874_45730 [Labrys miyagiensis]
MARVTYYVVQPFIRDAEGDLVAGDAMEAPASNAAKHRAAFAVAAGDFIGAIAFARTGDPQFGDFDDAIILGKYGETPESVAFLE